MMRVICGRKITAVNAPMASWTLRLTPSSRISLRSRIPLPAPDDFLDQAHFQAVLLFAAR